MRKHAEAERLLNGLLFTFETHITAAKTAVLEEMRQHRNVSRYRRRDRIEMNRPARGQR
jgi:hypothetical protein